MFKSARIKLTFWYLLIIMAISLSFSGVIYWGTTREMERGFHRAELRLRAQELGIRLPRRFSLHQDDLPPELKKLVPRFFFVEDLEAARERLLHNLVLINGIIFVFSATAGYFLAGKTLKPIAQALEEQKRFVGDASHELKTPLTVLKTILEVALRDRNLKLSEAKKTMRSSLEEIGSLQSLTRNLLALNNYSNNWQSLKKEKLEISQVIRKANEKIIPLVKRKKVNFKTRLKKGLVLGNQEALEQMMLIFLDNAIKYTPREGTVIVSLLKKGKKVQLRIKDTGVGISSQDLPLVFDRFFRADQSRTKQKVAGFGLGLSLAKKIIQAHQGAVTVKSILNKGTTFTISLPTAS
ncbi:sensor histidine kinase [Patescibacteria group bacterium]